MEISGFMSRCSSVKDNTMGGCTSSEKHERANSNSLDKPFFRRQSIYEAANSPWIEKVIYEDPSGFLPTEIKETVLQNVWCEKIEVCKENFNTEPCSDQTSDPRFSDENDHYDKIDENEMEDRRKSTYSTSPLLKPRKREKKSKSKHKRKSTTTADPRSRCLEYSEMVNIFKPLIVHSLHVHDILPSLQFLENHDDIYEQVKNHSPKRAVESLLDELERSEELGKWQKFIDALSANGYTYIVDNIRGYKFISHHYQREYIKNLTPKIGKMIVVRELLPYLLAKDLISDSDKEECLQVDENQGNYAAAVLLLDRIDRMHRNWYIVFIETLIDASMEDVAADLQIPELIESKRTKDTADCYSWPDRNKNQNNNSQSIDDVCLDENEKNPTRCSEKKKRCHRRSMLPRAPGRLLPPLPPNNDKTNMTQSKSAISTVDCISKEEARSRCLEYSEMVKIFKPLIVQNLLVHDILPSLHFLENYDDIYAEGRNHSPKNAVVRLLNELETSGELGKWQKFIDALIANGYTYIVDNIRGYKFISHKYQREYIRRLTPKIGKMIVARELLPHLLAKDLINDIDKENILREHANHGDFAAAFQLLDRIHRKHSNWYLLFIEALTEANMEEVAVDLRIPELLHSPRTKVTVVHQSDDDFHNPLPPLPTETDLSETERIKRLPLSPEQSEHVDNEVLDDLLQSETDEFYGYEEYETPPPPIPPRIRGNKRNKPYTVTSDTCDTYDDTCNYEDSTLETYLYEKRPDIYSKDSSQGEDNTNSKCKANAVHSKFKNLHDELDKMKKEHCDIHLEVGLLEQKSTLSTEINSGIRRRREILSDIALKEKERNALQMDPCANDETNVVDVKTDEYYPSTTKINLGEHKQAAITRAVLPTKQTIDYRERSHLGKLGVLKPNSLFVESPMSMIQIYSPTFESRSTLSHMFENDSGVALDIDLEFDRI